MYVTTRWEEKMKRMMLSLMVVLLLAGCASNDVQQYAGLEPKLDLFSYFEGSTRGYGIVQERSGRLTRQFVVDITGTMDSAGNLILDEQFVWNDGEMTSRIWTISRQEGTRGLVGEAADVIGRATGATAGNALNWQYQLALVVDGSTWNLNFDDWMFLQPDHVLLNRATMSKFGLRVGEVTIAFMKDQPVMKEVQP